MSDSGRQAKTTGAVQPKSTKDIFDALVAMVEGSDPNFHILGQIEDITMYFGEDGTPTPDAVGDLLDGIATFCEPEQVDKIAPDVHRLVRDGDWDDFLKHTWDAFIAEDTVEGIARCMDRYARLVRVDDTQYLWYEIDDQAFQAEEAMKTRDGDMRSLVAARKASRLAANIAGGSDAHASALISAIGAHTSWRAGDLETAWGHAHVAWAELAKLAKERNHPKLAAFTKAASGVKFQAWVHRAARELFDKIEMPKV